MPLKFAEEALRVIKSTFALTGKDAPTTELEDGLARQSLVINRLAAAGFSFGLGEGLFSGFVRHAHVAGGNISETINPYSAGAVAAPFPLALPLPATLWYLGCSIFNTSSQTSIDEVQVSMDPAVIEGWFDGTIAAGPKVIARWDTEIATAGQGKIMTNAASGACFQAPQFPIRWSRNNAFHTASKTVGAGASNIDFQSWWFLTRVGLYPSAV